MRRFHLNIAVGDAYTLNHIAALADYMLDAADGDENTGERAWPISNLAGALWILLQDVSQDLQAGSIFGPDDSFELAWRTDISNWRAIAMYCREIAHYLDEILPNENAGKHDACLLEVS